MGKKLTDIVLWGKRSVAKLGRREESPIVTLRPSGKPIGRVLFSYLKECLRDRRETLLHGHSNKWESREIAGIFLELGFVVDAMDWTNEQFVPKHPYDVIFDIFTNLQRLAPFLGPRAKKILHLTGSYAPVHNLAELERVRAFERRHGVSYKPRRLVRNLELYEKSLDLADSCSLIGNEYTLRTFPQRYRAKIRPVTVSASYVPYLKSPEELLPLEREFVWFFGSGAVHKGLDLVIEVFARHPELVLNVIGDVQSEADFIEAYPSRLSSLQNIRLYGYLDPSSAQFNQIVRRSFCFLAPSCSEGISPAAATCLMIGLYPVISRQTGITLPPGSGIYLETCSLQEIEAGVLKCFSFSDTELRSQIVTCQEIARQKYSRHQFSEEITRFLIEALRL